MGIDRDAIDLLREVDGAGAANAELNDLQGARLGGQISRYYPSGDIAPSDGYQVPIEARLDRSTWEALRDTGQIETSYAQWLANGKPIPD